MNLCFLKTNRLFNALWFGARVCFASRVESEMSKSDMSSTTGPMDFPLEPTLIGKGGRSLKSTFDEMSAKIRIRGLNLNGAVVGACHLSEDRNVFSVRHAANK